jgi:hypothetical protein
MAQFAVTKDLPKRRDDILATDAGGVIGIVPRVHLFALEIVLMHGGFGLSWKTYWICCLQASPCRSP